MATASTTAHPCCSAVPGVRHAGVFLLADTAHVELDADAVGDLRRVLAAVQSAGFTAELLDTAGNGVCGRAFSMHVLTDDIRLSRVHREAGRVT